MMIDRKKVWKGVVMWIGVISGILTIYQFYFHESPKNNSVQNTATQNSNPTKFTDDSLTGNPVFDSIRFATQVRPVSDSLREYTPAKDNNANTTTIETLKYTSALNSTNPNDGELAELTTAPPAKGFGKLAVRLNCSYCIDPILRVEDSVGGQVSSASISPVYDSLNKRETTFIQDFPVGRYKVIFDFRQQGLDTVNAKIKDGKATLVFLNKVNPFGNGNGRVYFKSFDSRVKFVEIDVDGKDIGSVRLKNDKSYYIDLDKGIHMYSLRNLEKDELSNGVVGPKQFRICEGCEEYINIQ